MTKFKPRNNFVLVFPDENKTQTGLFVPILNNGPVYAKVIDVNLNSDLVRGTRVLVIRSNGWYDVEISGKMHAFVRESDIITEIQESSS